MAKAEKKVLEISSGTKMRQIVEITVVKGLKNRKGLPFQESVTKHVPISRKHNKGGNDAE